MRNRLATRRIFTNLCFFAFFIVALPIQTLAAGGDLDTTFTAGVTTFGSTGSVVKVQADGRVLVGGNFRVVNGRSSPGLVRLNADGTIDQSFSVGTGVNFGAYINTIAVQTDGKILVGGGFIEFNGVPRYLLARLNSDGSLDTNFNLGGAGITNGFSVYAVALQPDGKILVGGSFSEYNNTTTNNFARLNSNGSLDTTFATNLGTGFDFTTNSIAVEPDGQIVVGGIFSTVNGTTAKLIARLNGSGTLDAAFTANGGTGFPAFTVNKVLLQSNGQILVGGRFFEFNGTPRTDLLRLNANGSLDMNFAPASNSSILDLLTQPNGQIIAAGGGAFGAMQERTFIARLNQADGSLDSTFDAGTTYQNTSGNTINSIALQLDGSIFAAGDFKTFSGVVRSNLAKLNPNGSLNAAFTTVIGSPGQVNELLVLPNNKILIGGDFRGVNESFRDAVARLNADGTTDTTFNSGLNTGGFGVVYVIAVQTNGQIIIGGNFFEFASGTHYGIARLNADGSLDTTFNASVNGFVYAVAIQPTDGKILVGGSFSNVNGVNGINTIARLNTDGTLDAAFNSGGAGFNGNVEELILQPNGQILVGGGFTEYNGATGINRITRLNSNGTRDTTFTTNTGAGFDNVVYTLALQPDGKILAGGFFTNFNGTNLNFIARLNANGTLDNTFNVGTGFNNSPQDLALQSDGRIIAAGYFTEYNGITRFELARLNTDGSLDSSFRSGVPANNNLLAVGLQTDGRIIIGGALQSYDGVPRFGIARVTAGDTITWTGAVNANWNTGANWTGGVVPTAADNAVIPNNFTVNLSGGNSSVLSLTVGANSTLTIASGSLTIEGGTNNGTIAGAGTLNFTGTSFGNNGTISVAAVNANVGTSGNKVLTGTGAFVGNVLTIEFGATLALQSNQQFNSINLQGNLDATSRTVTLRGANPLQGTGFIFTAFSTIIFDGAAAQNISHSANFNNLIINNQAGVSFGGNTNYFIAGTLNLTNGILNVSSANLLILDNNVVVVRTNGYVTGAVRKQFFTAQPAFTFPIGTANGYSPVTLNITSGVTEVTANVFQTTHPNFDLVAATSLHRYWTLTGTGTFTANLTFNYLQTDVFGNENNYLIARITNELPQSFPNNCAAGSPCVNAVANTATINGVTAFSDWTLAQFPPTAASVTVAGRVTDSNGKGIMGARISMIDENGNVRNAATNFYGYYRFAETPAGKTYILSARSKRHEFNPPTRVLFVGEDVSDADFIAAP